MSGILYIIRLLELNAGFKQGLVRVGVDMAWMSVIEKNSGHR